MEMVVKMLLLFMYKGIVVVIASLCALIFGVSILVPRGGLAY